MKQIIFSIIAIILLAGCGSPPVVQVIKTIVVEKLIEVTATSSSTSTITVTPTSTSTRRPTLTWEPSKTPRNTKTPTQTKTPTPKPEPITLSGSGDSVVDFVKWPGAAVLDITYIGASNFILASYDKDNQKIDSLVNAIGNYEGKMLMDVGDGDHSARFQVKSSGLWVIEIKPFAFENLNSAIAPATYEGKGDDVLFVGPGNLDLLKIDASKADSNFIVLVWTKTGRTLAVNEIAPYSGTVILSKDTFMLEVFAEGPWEIELTSK